MSSRKGRFKLVREQDATGTIRDIYEQIKSALGVPHVNLLFQAYAGIPGFLEAHWNAFQSVIGQQRFFDMANRLRAEAYTAIHNYFSVPDLCGELEQVSFSVGARHELTEAVDLFQYNYPPLLLLVSAQLCAFDPCSLDVGVQHAAADHPVITHRCVLVEEAQAASPVRKLFDDIKRTLELPYIGVDYQAFARWPDFLTAYWRTLKPITQSPVYKEQMLELRDSASTMGKDLQPKQEISVDVLQDSGMGDEDVETAVRVTEQFQRSLSGSLLNIAVAMIGVDGGNARPAFEVAKAGPERERAA